MDSAAYALFAKNYDAAEVYHAHELVHNASVQPFKTVDSSTLFNAARWVGRSSESKQLPAARHAEHTRQQ